MAIRRIKITGGPEFWKYRVADAETGEEIHAARIDVAVDAATGTARCVLGFDDVEMDVEMDAEERH